MNNSAGTAIARSRSSFLDFWKGVAALGVILVHIRFPGVYGYYLSSVGSAVGTCGVIFFFLISGYSIYDKNSSGEKICGKIMKRFGRNGKITLSAVLIYFLFTFVMRIISGDLPEWLLSLLDPVVILRMVFLGDFETITGDPLWFLPALLWSYLIFYFICRFGLQKLLHILTPFLLIMRIAVETYTNSFGADWHISGNAVVGALPVMALGHFIASKRDKMLSLPDAAVVISVVLSALCMFASSTVRIGSYDISQVFKILTAVLVFIYTQKHPGYSPSRLLERIGSRDSLHIYLWHFLIIAALQTATARMYTARTVIDWMMPIAVMALSVVLAELINKFPKRAG